jgi:hypothetical protein
MVTQVGYLVVRQSKGRVTLCAVYTVHMEMRNADFLVDLKTKVDGLLVIWRQNHWDDFLLFGLKTSGDSFPGFGLKTGDSGFPVWASKLATTV